MYDSYLILLSTLHTFLPTAFPFQLPITFVDTLETYNVVDNIIGMSDL